MKIKRLDVSGFKSFCDQTRVLFDSSLTAVVGPNGCGKSNIVDAIRWGLGEQSAKNLRGKGMEDVIFNGSEDRGPKSMAEVTITFDNNDGLSHPDFVEYPEVAVTRRLHRDGTSEYFINKAPCRLKDITELFLGTGGGARAYSIIEQGRIGLIVSSRSEDRRSMIEEAAGITRFKKARITANRKMDQTRQNLLRITDVVSEMERNLSSLKRQARKAERYKAYAGEQRDLEIYLASHKYLELNAATKVVRASLVSAQEEALAAQDALRLDETRVEKLRLDEVEARQALDGSKTAAYEADKEVQMIEAEIRHLSDTVERIRRDERSRVDQEKNAQHKREMLEEERAVLLQRVGALAEDATVTAAKREETVRLAEEARERLVGLGREFDGKRDLLSRARARVAATQTAFDGLHRRIEEAEARLETTRLERKNIGGNVAQLESAVEDLTKKSGEAAGKLEESKLFLERESEALEILGQSLDDCDNRRRTVRDELQAKTSRLKSLEEMHDGLERHDNSVREAVEALRDSDQGFAGLLVDYIECPEEYEVALAAALADRLQALVIEDHERGMEILGWLKDRDLGRVNALPLMGMRPSDDVGDLEGDGIVGRLSDQLTFDPKVQDAAQALLSSVYLANTAEDARAFWAACGGDCAVVTADGQLIDSFGMMRGGRAGSPGADLLGQRRLIRQLEKEVTALEANHSQLELNFETTKDELTRRKENAEKARVDLQEREVSLAELRKDGSRATEDLEGARQRLEGLERELTLQEEQVREARMDRDHAASQMAEAQDEIRSLEKIIAEHSALIEECRSEADRMAAAAADARVKEAQFEQQHKSAKERVSQIAQSIHDLSEAVHDLSRRKETDAKEMGAAAGRSMRCKESLDQKVQEARELSDKVAQMATALDARSEELAEAQLGLKERRENLETGKTAVADLRMAEQQAHMDVQHLLENVSERHDIQLLRVIGDYHMRPLPGQDVKLRIDELRRLIDRMGPINPAAIDEYEETKTRYEEKVEQKADVEQALEDLESAISRMDRDSRRMFKETFTFVNEKFQEIFPRLFKGGQAKLVLTDPDDMLATGVDIVAQPPGKNLGNIELMSGGEKALTAVSLLFAIFLHRPSPFCLLDEVDAPLDEANVGRFVDMVRELTDRSQFIVITHSKVTMEGADALYGVTMQEPGVSKLVSVRLVHSVKQAVNE